MNNAFAGDVYAHLAVKNGNLFFSPTSIQTALAMTCAGARGKTGEEMARTLRLDCDAPTQLGDFLDRLNADGAKRGYELALANGLWGQRGCLFLPDYLTLVKRHYGGDLSELDFVGDADGSRQTINDWVTRRTNDRIKDLIPPNIIDSDTRLILTNAIYFKGKWDFPFRVELTNEGEFTTGAATKIKASFMYQQARFRYAEDKDVQVLELPYGKNDVAMRIFLPKKVANLAVFEKHMTCERMAGLTGTLQQQAVKVWIPRFMMESQFSLADTLKAMGMKLAFDPDNANFEGMAAADQLFISAVIHKAFVKVDEEGTEAAAAAAVEMKLRGARLPTTPPVFRADHPFVFEIVHQASGAVLFMGRLTTP